MTSIDILDSLRVKMDYPNWNCRDFWQLERIYRVASFGSYLGCKKRTAHLNQKRGPEADSEMWCIEPGVWTVRAQNSSLIQSVSEIFI